MMKLNEQWSIEPDTVGWQLHETYEGIDQKTKLPKRMVRTTYPVSIAAAAKIISERSIRPCESIQQVNEKLNITSAEIATSMKHGLNVAKV